MSAIQNTGQNKLIVIIFLHYAAFTPIINNTKTQVGIRESSQIIKQKSIKGGLNEASMQVIKAAAVAAGIIKQQAARADREMLDRKGPLSLPDQKINMLLLVATVLVPLHL